MTQANLSTESELAIGFIVRRLKDACCKWGAAVIERDRLTDIGIRCKWSPQEMAESLKDEHLQVAHYSGKIAGLKGALSALLRACNPTRAEIEIDLLSFLSK